ncbi:ComEC/Rec2 family competence protein [Dokdonia ponticola]|uniref:ComEC/Rec2 family competence protein n=1 Tax=Dokdonia ponticola TaxID=2041041 RepID=A0ABV9HW42_9FLAO
MIVKFLKAHQGDSILLSFNDNENKPRNILIDGGMDGTYYSSSNGSYGQLKIEIEKIRNRKEKIDLLVLSHIDNDHINGLLRWFEDDQSVNEMIGNIWFNSGKLIAEYLKEPENRDLRIQLKENKSLVTGVTEALEFEKYLEKKDIWERRIIKKADYIEKFGLKINILTPTIKQLKKLLKEYKKRNQDNIYTSGRKKDWKTNLKDFINEESKEGFTFSQDSSVKNGSSIAMLIEYKKKNLLFLADSHPKEIVKSIKKLGYTYKKPLKVELFQVSHHGSKANNNKDLFKIIKSNHYVISTDSTVHNHPHKRTLSRIININPEATFYFNYESVRDNIFSERDFSDFKSFKAKIINEYSIY